MTTKLINFKLPGGRIVPIHADVAGFHNVISYQLADGSIVVAERVAQGCCESVSDGGDLCWFCEDEQKMLRYERGF